MPKVVAPELHQPKLNAALGYTPERVAHLKANTGVDPAMLASELGISERFVITMQRRLGLRKMRPSSTALRRKEELEGR